MPWRLVQLFRTGIISLVSTASVKKWLVRFVALMIGIQAQIAATMPVATLGDPCDELHGSVPATTDHSSAAGGSTQADDSCGCLCQTCHSPALTSPLVIENTVAVTSAARPPAGGQRHFIANLLHRPPRS